MHETINKLFNSYGYHNPFYHKSITNANKKYSVFVKRNNKTQLIHFGDRHMQHYKDRTKQKKWKHMNHNDKQRRASYLARAHGIKNKSGQYTARDNNSANYYSIKYLW